MTQFTAAQIAEGIGAFPPTDQQAVVIEAAPHHPTLVVAGAGSGKTETMSVRMVWLIANGYAQPEEVLGLTFTKKAAGELAERVATRLGRWRRSRGQSGAAFDEQDISQPVVATYNSYAAGLVKQYGLHIGIDPEAKLLSEAARWQLANQVISDFEPGFESEAAISTLTSGLLALHDELNQHLLSAEPVSTELRAIAEDVLSKELAPRARTIPQAFRTLGASLDARAQLVDLVERYRQAKQSGSWLDYSDQVRYAYQIAREVPQAVISERTRYRQVILDEYQDTSFADLRLLNTIFGSGHPVMAVGDPNQSIYGWRGASAGGLEQFPVDFPAADGAPAQVAHLTTAWRNDQQILDVANQIAAPLLQTSTVEVKKLSSRPQVGSGEVQVVMCETSESEANAVADFITANWDPESGKTAAVLCRKRAQFETLAAVFAERELPYEVVGLGGLLAVPEVVEVVSFLTAAYDPGRGDAVMRLLTGPQARLGLQDIGVLGSWARTLSRRGRSSATGSEGREPDLSDEASLIDAIDQLPDAAWVDPQGRSLSETAQVRIKRLGGLLQALRRSMHLPLPELVITAQRLLGLDVELAARRGGGRIFLQLDRLVTVAQEYQSQWLSSETSLGAFLQWLDDAMEHDNGLEPGRVAVRRDAIQLLTVHGAKGLEWDVVAVPGLVNGGLPSVSFAEGKPKESGWLTGLKELPYELRGDGDRMPSFDTAAPATYEHLTELTEEFKYAVGAYELVQERRVAYVAVTRARSHLFLSGSWWVGERVTPAEPSTFLQESARVVQQINPARVILPEKVEETNPQLSREVSTKWPEADLLEPAEMGALRRGAQAVLAAEAAIPPGQLGELLPQLLAQRAQSGQANLPQVDLSSISASSAVSLVRDPAAYLHNLRRPVPARPFQGATRGTAFHEWVEQYFRTPALFDSDQFQFFDDDAPTPDIDELIEVFNQSAWAQRKAVAIEVDVQTPVAGRILRCRIDAVFAGTKPNTAEVVDWKTGRIPTGEDLVQKQLQLQLYRLAWARRAGLPIASVSAKFVYLGAEITEISLDKELDESQIERLLADAILQGLGKTS